MINEAEKYKEDDKKLKKLVEAKNSLENYCFSTKNNVLSNENLKNKISEEDTKTIEELVEQTINWLDEANDDMTAEDYESKQKEVESVITPILQKAYQSPDQAQAEAEEQEQEQEPVQEQPVEPTIEEVD